MIFIDSVHPMFIDKYSLTWMHPKKRIMKADNTI